MSNFKNNPKRPMEVRVPNKIRKRITMHKKDADGLGLIEAMIMPTLVATTIKRKRPMWLRFTRGLANLLQNKPCKARGSQ
ncbi:hypothetical protein LCGC14_2368450 [marine sediment metagenome]|uniref:Uncharacterized protein n=1 Tax=marine sediment metagenome TaxID=412755 RepID=A0A0F9CRR1_9ZZZZ